MVSILVLLSHTVQLTTVNDICPNIYKNLLLKYLLTQFKGHMGRT